MKEIKLSQGKVAMVDDSDYDYLMKWKWCAQKSKQTFYAVRNPNIKMHRVIMCTPEDMQIDHINGNGLDNQKYNLRNCTPNQNRKNRKRRKNGTSKYKGVCYHRGGIEASAWANNTKYIIGYFKTEEAAAMAYDEKAKELHGEFANLNFK
jgi:hypothetical protein